MELAGVTMKENGVSAENRRDTVLNGWNSAVQHARYLLHINNSCFDLCLVRNKCSVEVVEWCISELMY